MINKQIALCLGTLMIVVSLAFQSKTLRAGSVLPSLQTLKAVTYSKSEKTVQNDIPSYADLQNFFDACRAYSHGLIALPGYRQPVLTRGSNGISVFRKVSPSVVMVVTGNFTNDKLTDLGLGTGVIIDSAGYVLTNWHVIHGYQAGIIFLKPEHGTEPDKNQAYGVHLVAQSEQADLALLKIDKPPAGLNPVTFGNIASIQVAEDIHIIGHPHGQLWSYSTGVISQIRDNYGWNYSDGSKHLADVLQMQTAINPGNSGGPVLDNDSNMLGLVAMSEEGQNLNYAVAIDVIKDFVSSSMARRSRGVRAVGEAKSELYRGQTQDGFSIEKNVYANLTSYTVRDTKGAAPEMIAESSDGAVLTGSNTNGFGGFSDWTFKSPSGGLVYAKSSGTSPDLIFAK